MGKVVIVDDHPLMRLAVRAILEGEGYAVVAEADNGSQAIDAVRRFTPDLVILDLDIPNRDGFSVISHLRAIEVETKILVLTSSHSRGFSGRCLQAGASGFLCKEESLYELRSAARALLSGYSFFPADAIHSLQYGRQPVGMDESLASRLSDRELVVLRLLGQGLKNTEIAERLLISHKTVSTYKTRLLQKCNVSGLVELVELARSNGID